MPGSIRENDQFVREFVFNNGIQTMLDVGPGQGTYADLLADLIPIGNRYAIEAWKPYIAEYSLRDKYNAVLWADAREQLRHIPAGLHDLVIFGDVLEHMTEEESVQAWKEAARISRWGLISVPIVHYPQGAEGGNPYEVHVQDHLTPEKVRDMFGPFDSEALYPWTGTFIKRF